MITDLQTNALWWNTITGPSRFAKALAQSILNGTSIVISEFSDLPLSDHLFGVTEHLVVETDPSLRFYRNNCADDELALSAPAEYLLNCFAPQDVADGYSSSSGMSKQEYLINNAVLENRVIWLSGLSEEAVFAWKNFCKGFRLKNHSGAIVVESTGDIDSSSTFKTIHYRDYVTEYDALVFADIIASNLDCSKEWKGYIAHLAIHLLGMRIEHYEDFILNSGIMNAEPETLLPTDCASGDSTKHIWEAQIEKLFSLVERERIKFIDEYRADITKALSQEYWDEDLGSYRTIQQDLDCGENIYSLEVGVLHRMSYLRRDKDRSPYLLYLKDESAKEKLRLLRGIRNKLAHMNKCTIAEVKALFAYSE
jgi:hypothetical protein